MSLLFANHSVRVFSVTETADPETKVVPVPTESAGVSRTVQIKPIKNGVRVEMKPNGDIVELLNPHELKCEPDEVDDFPYGARVVWDDTGDQFRITKKATVHAAGGDFEELNFGRCEMELLEIEVSE